MSCEQEEDEKVLRRGSLVSPECTGSLVLPFPEIALAVLMGYLRLAQWSRAQALGAEPGLGHGSH